MPRGRPKKVVPDKQGSTQENIIEAIASVIQQESCHIPGCVPRLHQPEARIILNSLRQAGVLREGV